MVSFKIALLISFSIRILSASESLHFPSLHSILALGLCKSDGNFKQYLHLAAREDEDDAIKQILRICKIWNEQDIFSTRIHISDLEAFFHYDSWLKNFFHQYQLPALHHSMFSLNQAFREFVFGVSDTLPNRLFQVGREESSGLISPQIYDYSNNLDEIIEIDIQNVPAYIVTHKPADQSILIYSSTIMKKITLGINDFGHNGSSRFAVYSLDIVFVELQDVYYVVKPITYHDGESAWQTFSVHENPLCIQSSLMNDVNFIKEIASKEILLFYRHTCIFEEESLQSTIDLNDIEAIDFQEQPNIVSNAQHSLQRFQLYLRNLNPIIILNMTVIIAILIFANDNYLDFLDSICSYLERFLDLSIDTFFNILNSIITDVYDLALSEDNGILAQSLFSGALFISLSVRLLLLRYFLNIMFGDVQNRIWRLPL